MSELERPYFPESVNHIIRAIGEGSSGGGGTEHAELLGLSTDTKPTNVPVYSLFLELDTGDIYYYDGAGWTKLGEVPKIEYNIIQNTELTGALRDGMYLFSLPVSQASETAVAKLQELLEAENVPELIISCNIGGVEAFSNVATTYNGSTPPVWDSADLKISVDVNTEGGSPKFEIWVDETLIPGGGDEITAAFDLKFEG